jgi:hypothetical protein
MCVCMYVYIYIYIYICTVCDEVHNTHITYYVHCIHHRLTRGCEPSTNKIIPMFMHIHTHIPTLPTHIQGTFNRYMRRRGSTDEHLTTTEGSLSPTSSSTSSSSNSSSSPHATHIHTPAAFFSTDTCTSRSRDPSRVLFSCARRFTRSISEESGRILLGTPNDVPSEHTQAFEGDEICDMSSTKRGSRSRKRNVGDVLSARMPTETLFSRRRKQVSDSDTEHSASETTEAKTPEVICMRVCYTCAYLCVSGVEKRVYAFKEPLKHAHEGHTHKHTALLIRIFALQN